MIKILFVLLGYKKYKLNEESRRRAIRIFWKNKINIKIENGEFFVPLFRCKKIENLLNKRVDYEGSKARGIGGFIYENRKRYGIFSALFIILILLLLSNDIVWDVRIEGSELGNEQCIKKEMENVGFGVGSRWSKTDKSKIEISLLENSALVSWVNINRRGGVAYIKVIDKITYEEEKPSGFANIVASFDCIIEEVNVFKGFSLVKPGDVVKKGEILISGIIPENLGGGFCYAEGEVKGRVTDEIEVFVNSKAAIKDYYSYKTGKISIKFFNFSINILNLCGNSRNECDIIETVKEIRSHNGVVLPILFVKTTIAEYNPSTVFLTAEEMAAEASLRMKDAISKRLENATLVKIKTDGAFEGEAYKMSSVLIVVENIGVTLKFNEN